MSRVVITPPAKLAVSIGETKSHARITNDLGDADLYSWLLVAIDEAQRTCNGRQLITAIHDEYFEAWPCKPDAKGDLAFPLYWAPLQSVATVKYLDTAGALQTWDPSNYLVDTVSPRGRVIVKPTVTVPALADQSQAIVIRHTSGYGLEPDTVPEPIRQWIKVHVATCDGFREAFAERAPAEVPRSFVDGLLDFYRLPEAFR